MCDCFDIAAAALIPDHDGTLATARAGVSAWCDRYGLPCLLHVAAGCPVPTAETADLPLGKVGSLDKGWPPPVVSE